MLNLNGVQMLVSSTAPTGVVGSDTHLQFTQRGSRVAARYADGRAARGCLAGTIAGSRLVFRYLQREESGEIHGGSSVCQVERRLDGRLRIIEHFTWSSRPGCGVNVFDEVPGQPRPTRLMSDQDQGGT